MSLLLLSLSLNWFLQFLFTALILALGLLYLLKNTASNYFLVDANFASSTSSSLSSESSSSSSMPCVPDAAVADPCAACGKSASKKCSRCKAVRYCSATCQLEHWNSGHKRKCKELAGASSKSAGPSGGKRYASIALIPSSHGLGRNEKQLEKVLFPYDEFIKLFNWDTPGFPPCGLLNCGNSCFANVVLQCLAHTRPLLAYLLDKGHRRGCRRNEWCFFCELQTHVERASRSQHPFSPINILSRLPSIGGNLGYGKQEDAHEFMRFAIDTMQSACLDEHGGEEVVHPKSQETTLIQHIFGGQLQSQVICTECNQVSNQYENMMDLTVEIHGDATSLEECLDQFTVKECLHGDNMYKCDGCNDYVKAWKRLTVCQAPNILTIALKRFQSGRFGKLNKRITFPESLDLSPYMSGGDGMDQYKLYAVVVHVDMLNASFFGHYICYTKDFQGNWYRIDDCKVMRVELDEVFSQGAYMLLYSRISARPSCLVTFQSPRKQEEKDKVILEAEQNCPNQVVNSSNCAESTFIKTDSDYLPASEAILWSNDSPTQKELSSSGVNCEYLGEVAEHLQTSSLESSSSISTEFEVFQNGGIICGSACPAEDLHRSISSEPSSSDGHTMISFTNGSRMNSISLPDVASLPSSTKIASTSHEPTLDRTSPVGSSGSSVFEGRAEQFRSENDLRIFSSTDSLVAVKKDGKVLLHNDTVIHKVSGKCNGFGDHDFVDGNIDFRVEEQFQRCLNDVEMADLGSNGLISLCNGKTNDMILEETVANSGQDVVFGKMPSEPVKESYIANGTAYSSDKPLVDNINDPKDLKASPALCSEENGISA
ncbi:Ubiquitin carboxyl-terminal hydrolase 18 [Ancistrocladus abbreviatus]